jgi:hypothetical protein
MDQDEEVAALRRRLSELEAQPAATGSRRPTPKERREAKRTLLIGGAVATALVVLIWAARQSGAPGARDIPTPSAVPAPSHHWTYDHLYDRMTPRRGDLACVVSSNPARLAFPYHDNPVELCVRRPARGEFDIYLRLQEGGQFHCYIDRCRAEVQFDADPPKGYRLLEASDGSSDIVFFSSPSKLLARLKGASTTKVEVEFFQNGSQILEFNTAGLKWPIPEDATSRVFD